MGMTGTVLNVCSKDNRSREEVSVSSMHQKGEGNKSHIGTVKAQPGERRALPTRDL